MTNVIVVFSKLDDGKRIKSILVKNGFQVVALCTSGAQVLSQADDLKSGIVVSGFQYKDMTCCQLESRLSEGFDVLMIASPARWSGENMGKIVCLPAPFKAVDLVGSVRLMERLQMEKKRLKRNMAPKRSEEERRIMEQAKQVLIDRNGMTEPEAHRYLQKCSMDSGTDMVEAARMVLSLYR